MSTIQKTIDVKAPISAVYNQWTQFEEFPEFLGAVKSVEQIDDVLTHWVVSIGGVRREFDAAITDQVPDDHVAWASVDERVHAGRVAFQPIDPQHTRVKLEMLWEPETLVEKAGAALGIDERQAEMDLERFRSFIEERGSESGAWRGEIHGAQRTDEAGMSAPVVEEIHDGLLDDAAAVPPVEQWPEAGETVDGERI